MARVRIQSSTTVLALALTCALVGAVPASAAGTRVATLTFLPPAGTSSAILGQSWHKAMLAGDSSEGSGCHPTTTSCDALDWDSGGVGSAVYFRAYGYYSGGTSTGLLTAYVSTTKTITCGVTVNNLPVTIHYIYVYVKNSAGNYVGTLMFQHAATLWTTTHTLTITLSSGSTYNNVQIAKMTSDTDTHGDWALNKQCWQGAHAHEDTYHKSSDSIVSTQKGFWSFNDLKFFGKKGVSFPINSSNWTRQLEYDF